MVEKIIKYKNYLLGVIGVLLVLTMLVGIKYLMKSKYEELPEVKLKEEINTKKSFAIMIQKGDGYEEYKSEDNTWPGADYVFKEAKCTDNNGALVDNAITFADGKATLTTNQTIYCTLYFDIKQIPEIVKQLRTKDSQGYLSEDLQGGMYRYQAAFEEGDSSEMTNWICFGTTDNCSTDETDSDSNNIPDGIDKYMYRIIGVTEDGEMKLIKETFLKEGETNRFAWNSKTSLPDCLGDACEWPHVELFKRLNGTSNGKTSGTGGYPNYIGDTDIFVDSSEYEYLKSGDSINGTKDEKGSEWYQLIADHDWMYGDTNEYNTANSYNGDYMYGIETGNTTTRRYWPDEGQNSCSNSPCTEKSYTWSKIVPTKIGLIYMHDIDYAYTGGNPGNEDNVTNSWVFFRKDGYNKLVDYEWLMTRFGVVYPTNGVIDSLCLYWIGELRNSDIQNVHGARPVFYLNSKVKIKDGDGTKENPFIIDITE